jgi:hypothetical protein
MTPASALAEHGFVAMQDLWAAEQTAGLTSEARIQARCAHPWGNRNYLLSSDGQVSSPRRHRSAGPGPTLRAVHESVSVRSLLRELTGLYFFPTRASYLYYAPGDFIGLHTDIEPCQLTLVTSVLGNPDPLVIHTEFADVPSSLILETARRTCGLPAGGDAIPVPRGGALLLRGSRVPHHRPPARGNCAIATLCYAALA